MKMNQLRDLQKKHDADAKLVEQIASDISELRTETDEAVASMTRLLQTRDDEISSLKHEIDRMIEEKEERPATKKDFDLMMNEST